MFKTTHMQFHLQPKTSGNDHSSSTPSKTGTTYHQILQLPSHLSCSKLKWQNSLNRHCTYGFIQFLTLGTPARIFSMLNVGSIRKKKKKKKKKKDRKARWDKLFGGPESGGGRGVFVDWKPGK